MQTGSHVFCWIHFSSPTEAIIWFSGMIGLALGILVEYIVKRHLYRHWTVYRLVMGKHARPAPKDEEVAQKDAEEQARHLAREEENERRLHERIRQNAQRDFSQLGFPADPLKPIGSAEPENGERKREKKE